jgi:hypothetical protein
MAGRLRDAAEITFRDLDQNPELCDESREPVVVSGEGFEAIAAILQELPTLAAENRREDFEEALEEFEAERLAVLDATQEIQAQMSGRERRCPRCGSSEEGERCHPCGLVRLYPDPGQLRDYSHKSAQLSPLHQQVYQAYVSVLKGELSLEGLVRKLPLLSSHLKEMLRLCDRGEKSDQQAHLLASLRADIQTGVAGVERIQGVALSYRTSDLNRGWEDIFESSVAIQRDLSYFGASTAPSQFASRDADGFDFGGGFGEN